MVQCQDGPLDIVPSLQTSRDASPEHLTGILKFIGIPWSPGEIRVKIPDFSQVFIQLPIPPSYIHLV